MNTQQVAEKLVAMCREGKNREALEELYADNCTSREMPGMPNDFVEGKSAITKKSEDWHATVEEFHSGEISDPLVGGDYFSCTMKFDITFKDRGRSQMEELCVYSVRNGKISSEQFFYTMGE